MRAGTAVDGASDRNQGDRALVRAIAEGDEGALAEAYRRHGRQIIAIAGGLVGAEHAEEVAQDIFANLWRSPERYCPARGSLQTFLLVQVHGRVVDRVRSDVARRKRELATARDASPVDQNESVTIQGHLASGVSALLAELDERRRRPIEMAFFGGHTYAEVAVILDLPEGTVKSRIRVGLAELRTQLERQPSQPSPLPV